MVEKDGSSYCARAERAAKSLPGNCVCQDWLEMARLRLHWNLCHFGRPLFWLYWNVRFFERARLQSCRKCRKMNAGFTGCGKTNSFTNFKGFVTGHDFSCADKANKINVGL
jgi:hypothetical protein